MSRTIKDRPFERVIKKAGYDSVAKFAEACDMHPQAIFKHIRGQFRPSVDAMFVYAKALCLPFGDVFEVFYGEELEKLNVYLASKGHNVI